MLISDTARHAFRCAVTVDLWARRAIMQKTSLVALLLVALVFTGAYAAPRNLLTSSETAEIRDAAENNRILAELEAVHELRERMLADGETA